MTEDLGAATEEFREWIEYLAGRDHVASVGAELAAMLAAQLCGAPQPAPPDAFPRACELALMAPGLALVQGAPRPGPALQDHFARHLRRSWRAAAAGLADPAAWDAHQARAAALSHRFAAARAKITEALGTEREERIHRLAEVSGLLFARVWRTRSAQILTASFRGAFCRTGKGVPAVLHQALRTALRDAGSHSLVEDGQGRDVPMISGTQVRQVTRLLRLSDRVVLRARLAAWLSWPEDGADAAAQALVEERGPGVAELGRLLAAIAARRGGRIDGPAAARMAVETWAGRPEHAPRPEEEPLSAVHAEAVLRLCRADPDLPQDAATIREKLRRFGGAVRPKSLQESRGDDGGAEFGDQLPAGEGFGEEDGPLFEALMNIFGKREAAMAAIRGLHRVLPAPDRQVRGALLLGLPALLPRDTLPTYRLLAERGAPRDGDAEGWNHLSRLLQATKAALKAERAEIIRLLSTAFDSP